MIYDSVRKKKPEAKIPVEKLQDSFLQGPADEPIQKVLEDLQVDQVVLSTHIPKMHSVVFRNQRDPGNGLDFFYASGTHPFKTYKLIDGETYQLPDEVVRNLEGCKEDIHKLRKNSEGLEQIYVAGYKSHFVCERA